MNYIVACYFIILVIFGGRCAYKYYKFTRYCETHYPQKGSEFLSLGTITVVRALFKEHEIDDAEFVKLKNEAKNAYIGVCAAFLCGILFIIVTMLLSFKG